MKFILKVSDYTKEFYISLAKLTSRSFQSKNSKRVKEKSLSLVFVMYALDLQTTQTNSQKY